MINVCACNYFRKPCISCWQAKPCNVQCTNDRGGPRGWWILILWCSFGFYSQTDTHTLLFVLHRVRRQQQQQGHWWRAKRKNEETKFGRYSREILWKFIHANLPNNSGKSFKKSLNEYVYKLATLSTLTEMSSFLRQNWQADDNLDVSVIIVNSVWMLFVLLNQ